MGGLGAEGAVAATAFDIPDFENLLDFLPHLTSYSPFSQTGQQPLEVFLARFSPPCAVSPRQ